MWRIGVAGIVLAALLSGLIGAARWIGHEFGPEPFPLPDADGYWQGVDLFASARGGIVETLNAHPDVIPGSAQFIEIDQPVSEGVTLQFRYAPGSRSVRVYLQQREVTLSSNWRPDAPLLWLGDMLAAYGPPERVSIEIGIVTLYYPHLTFSVKPARTGPDWVQLAASDPVGSFKMIDPDVSPDSRPLSGAALQGSTVLAWRGLGLYRAGE